jgi:TctA family transporter
MLAYRGAEQIRAVCLGSAAAVFFVVVALYAATRWP